MVLPVLVRGLALVLIWLALLVLARWLESRDRLSAGAWLDVAVAGIIGMAVLGFFWRMASGQAYMPADGGDLASFLYPTYRFAAETLRSGHLPLWNPHLYVGSPFAADPQSGFLYPVNLLAFLALPEITYRALEGLSLFHFWWIGLGTYFFLRELPAHRRLSRWAALAGALAVTFSDPMLTHFGNLNLIAVGSWLPWTLWAFRRGEAGRPPVPGHPGLPRAGRTGWRWTAVAGLLLGIGTLAGHPQTSLFIGLALALDAALRLLTSPPPPSPTEEEARGVRLLLAGWAPAWEALARLAGVAVIAGLVAAPVLWPAWELARHTSRVAWDYAQTVGYSFSPAQLIGLIVPGFFGRGPQFHWGPWERVEAGYLGILPLVLGGLAVAVRRDRVVWRLAGLAAGSLLIALGIYALPHGWLTWIVPGLSRLRAPARILLVTDLALAALAALGLDAVLQGKDVIPSGTKWSEESRRRVSRRPFARSLSWRSGQGLAQGDVHGYFQTRVWERARPVWRGTWVVAAGLGLLALGLYLALIARQDAEPAVTSGADPQARSYGLHIAVALISTMLSLGFALAALGWLAAWRSGIARRGTLAWVAVALILLDLGSGAYNDLSGQEPTAGFNHPALVAFLRAQPGPFRIDARTGVEAIWQPSAASVHGLDDVGGAVNPLVLADTARYWEGLGSRSSRLYDFLNAGYVIGHKDVALDWDKFEPAFDGDPELNVYRNRSALPRAQVVYQAIVVEDHEQAWAAIHAPGFDPARQVVVEGVDLTPSPNPLPLSTAERGRGPGGKGEVGPTVEWQSDGPNRVRLTAELAAPGYLAISQAWYPGWQARLETGERPPVLRANYAFQAVPLPAGRHAVTLIFRPWLWWVGVIVGVVTLVGLPLAGVGGALYATTAGASGRRVPAKGKG